MIRSRKCRLAMMEQVGDIFRLTIFDTGEIIEYKNPVEAKRTYDLFLTDNIGFGNELEINGYNRCTGEKEVIAVDCKSV